MKSSLFWTLLIDSQSTMATATLPTSAAAATPDPPPGELPAELSELALNELREDAAVREHALGQMRHFIEKHPAIKRCRTDAPFLLRFLRTKKFSVPQSCAMLERYLSIRQLHPQWFRQLDPSDPALAAVLDAGYLVPLPKRDRNGRQVILSCAGRFDPHAHTSSDMARAHGLVCEALLDDARSQLLGYCHLNDESGLSMAHLSLWSLADIRTMLGCIQNSTPMRHKETHFINVPHYGNKVLEFAISMLSDKLKNRVMLHRTLDDLKKHIDPEILPAEYGGDVPLSDMIAAFKQQLLEQRDELLALDDMFIDLDVMPSLAKDLSEDSGLVGSFRKLEVD